MLGMDSTGLVQEFVPARGSYIVRVEVLNGKYLYAIKIHITGETFDLCPADICKTPLGVELNRAACPVDAPKTGLTVEAFDTPPEVIEEVERLMAAAGIELGGVEFMVDDRDGRADVLRHQCAVELCGGWTEGCGLRSVCEAGGLAGG